VECLKLPTSLVVKMNRDAVHFLARHFGTLLRVASRSRWHRGHSVVTVTGAVTVTGVTVTASTRSHNRITSARHVPPYTSNNCHIINVHQYSIRCGKRPGQKKISWEKGSQNGRYVRGIEVISTPHRY
jgi:hypothetical protein